MPILKENKTLIALASLILLFSYLASLFLTSFGSVEVKSLRLDTQNGQYIIYDLYKPKTATKDSKAPFIAIIPGFQRSKEALSNIAIELSRRGYVIALIDPYAQGLSSSSLSTRAATTEGYGMFALVEHIHSGAFEFVDTNKIGATGHSMGGNAAIRGADFFGKQATEKNIKSKLDSVYVSGYVLTLRNNILRNSRSNMGVSYALYDEGAFRNKLKNGDMRFAPEALRVVNSGRLKTLPKLKEVELDKLYGNINDRTARIVHNEPLLHPFQPYNGLATANQIKYFETVFSHKSELSPEDQIWQWKEFLGLVSLITSLVMLIPLGRILLKVPYFNEIVNPVPNPSKPPVGRGKIIFWSLFGISALIACVSFIPMVEVSKQLFVDASTRKQTWFFPQRMNNPVMLWAVFNGFVGFLFFFLTYKLFGKKNGVNPMDWGIFITKKMAYKTFILGSVSYTHLTLPTIYSV